MQRRTPSQQNKGKFYLRKKLATLNFLLFFLMHFFLSLNHLKTKKKEIKFEIACALLMD